MVRKTTFTKDDVVGAAIAVIETEGISQLTARKVADKMGASTAPVYSNFSTMEELAGAAKMFAVEKMMQLMEKPEEVQEFMNIGIGVLLFARHHPHLYDALFLQPATMYDPGPQFMDRILKKMETYPELSSLQPIERIILLKKMAIFTHGMATEICNGFLDHYQWRELVLLLEEVGEALITGASVGPQRTDKDMKLLGTFWSQCHKSTIDPENNQNKGESDE